MRDELNRRALLAGLGAGLAAGALSHPARAAKDDDGPSASFQNQAIEVKAAPIAHFERADPDRKQFGTLEYRGGLVLTSHFEHFGGLSGLVTDPDGSGLVSITDVGGWLSARIAYDGDKPSGLTEAVMGPLRDSDGRPLKDKKYQDAEGLALLDGTLAAGTLLVGFEREHRIVRYPIRNRTFEPAGAPLKLPADARRMPKNQGFEAVTVLRGGPRKGSIVAFAERFTRGSGLHTGWIWIDGEPQKFQLTDIDVFDITDAASLDNGDMLVLERRFRWTEGVQMRLRRIAAADIAPGARLTGEILLRADGNFQIDNMEGVSVHRDPAGRQVVTLISDDNFNGFLQRTLLLQFTLGEKGKAAIRT